MVGHAADDEGLAIVFRQDASEVTVQLVAERFVAEERTAVFGGEDGVNQNLGEGLRHGAVMPKAGDDSTLSE